MKKNLVFLILLFTNVAINTSAQELKYTYRLGNSFNPDESGGPVLVQIPNNSGMNGEFVTRPVPASTCEQGGNANGYFFEDDAGLQFNNPENFISNTYSLALIFQFDEFITPPMWVRLLSFTHEDDVGIYIRLTNPPVNGTLEFWPYGTVGEDDFFNTVDFYQLILVRYNSGIVKVYVNGQLYAEYDDSSSQAYFVQDPYQYIIFFRDHPSVLANEASPGFVSNIIISNITWDENKVAQMWEDFCASLLYTGETLSETTKIFPNPVIDRVSIELEQDGRSLIRVMDMAGKTIREESRTGKKIVLDVEEMDKGIYILQVIQNEKAMVQKFAKN